MQKITTHLWYDRQAREAAEFYTSAFTGTFGKSGTTGKITGSSELDGTRPARWTL